MSIDGRPLEPTARVPAGAFTVRWTIVEGHPFGTAYPELSGRVDLIVLHEDDGLSALVRPMGLRVSTAAGSALLTSAFATRKMTETPPTPSAPPA